MKLFRCKHCGNIIEYAKNSGVKVVCCGEPMEELVANSTDAAVEKHVPVVTKKCNTLTVTVSSVEHPMTPEHFIEWVKVETNLGVYHKNLSPNTPPVVSFNLQKGEQVKLVLAYCNLHGLWRNN
ncbi:MAG: desulfoferrodoxin [Clostridia bacterium]|nr:desulfoferrodoxin [Clostridia bacterium]